MSDLHYLSPSGCTFWGKKPWSRKKKLICQLGTLVGAPVGIALLAGISVGVSLGQRTQLVREIFKVVHIIIQAVFPTLVQTA